MNTQATSLAVTTTLVFACALLLGLAARPARASAQVAAASDVQWSPWSLPVVSGVELAPVGHDGRAAKAAQTVSPVLVFTSRVEVPPDTTGSDRELASINAASHAATDFYIASPLLLAASFGLAIGSFVEGPGLCWGPCSPQNAGLMDAFAVLSVVTLVGSLVSLIAGIALDVDSGSRRGAWQARHQTGISWRLDGAPGDVGIGITGNF